MSEEKKIPFVERLLALPREDLATYEGADPKTVMERVTARAAELNKGNPFRESQLRRDQLRRAAGFWKAIGADNAVISWICYGYEVKCESPPENLSFPNAGSYSSRPHEAKDAIQQDIEEGSFREVHHSFANVINSIQLEPKGEAWRLCHNTQYLNSKTATAHFQLATLKKSLQHILQKDDVLLTIDLEKAYYSVPMAEASWPNLCFQSVSGVQFGEKWIPEGLQ